MLSSLVGFLTWEALCELFSQKMFFLSLKLRREKKEPGGKVHGSCPQNLPSFLSVTVVM